MIIRSLKFSDLLQIDEFWRKHHKGIRGIPERKFILSEAVVEENDKVFAYGIVRFFAEALIFMNNDVSSYKRAKAFKLMMDQAIRDGKQLDLDNINFGVDDPHFEEILKSYGMTDRGKVLALGFNDGKP